MRALWSDRQNRSHNVSQKVKRIRRFSEMFVLFVDLAEPHLWHTEIMKEERNESKEIIKIPRMGSLSCAFKTKEDAYERFHLSMA